MMQGVQVCIVVIEVPAALVKDPRIGPGSDHLHEDRVIGLTRMGIEVVCGRTLRRPPWRDVMRTVGP